MKTTLTRLFTVMMLIIVSMGAMADVKVLFGEKGDDKVKTDGDKIEATYDGGTIVVTQKVVDATKVTVFLTVTPNKNYKLAENGLEVYAVIPSDISPTRGLEVSTALTLKSEDFKDEASKRTYTTTIDSKLALWLKSADFQPQKRDGAKGTVNNYADGLYYIMIGNVYAWRAITEKTSGQPYLSGWNSTSFNKTVNGNNYNFGRAHCSWIMKKVTVDDDTYYTFINAATNQYVVWDSYTSGTAKAVHLETRETAPTVSNDHCFYTIYQDDTDPAKKYIHPDQCKTNTIGLNYKGDFKETDNLSVRDANGRGLIQFYNGTVNSLSSTLLNAPTISDVDLATSKVSVTDNNGLPSGYNVRYTFSNDGTPPEDPTASSSTMPEEGLLVTEEGILKVVIERYGVVLTEVTTSYVEPTNKCAKPVIAKGDHVFTITCSHPTSGVTIYYTTDDGITEEQLASSPATYGNEYPTTGVSFTDYDFTVKAVAVAEGFIASRVATQYIGEDLTGEGTAESPYLIRSDNEFSTFVGSANSPEGAPYHYKLMANISGGSEITTPFTGTFEAGTDEDGNFYKISGLSHALFNSIDGGTVKNVMLDNVSINVSTNAGAICNEAIGDSRIFNCGVLATASEFEADENGYTVITSCSSTIGGNGYVGGIVGLLDGSSRVINCFSYAEIVSGTEVGGIVGHNNVATTSAVNNQKTMVMNCMFYGDITGGHSKAPIYNGEIITNRSDASGVSNFNYFWAGASYVQKRVIDVYNCALSAETRFLQRFEFFRHLLNSNRALAAWWATGSRDNKDELLKWVMEPSQIGSTTPYPILKVPGRYRSMVYIDDLQIDETAHTGSSNSTGTKLGTLSVTVQKGTGNAGDDCPGDASIINSSLTLDILDKDPAHFNFNYYKVQLPYYNDVGTGNYTDNKVVTGWKIVSMSKSSGSFTPGSDATAEVDDNDDITFTTPYNFADRKCTGKDLYNYSERVFSQGAYFDVPEGVLSITIEPYWAKCVYVSDQYPDVVYNQVMTTPTNVTNVGGGQRYSNNTAYSINGSSQKVYTKFGGNDGAVNALNPSGTVYDNAIVLVGNVHSLDLSNKAKDKPYTIMSIDLDKDNEPDYSYILRFNSRLRLHPVRVDFLNVIGLGMAQKSDGGEGTYNFGIMQPYGWFECTNTGLFRVTQFEYDYGGENTSEGGIGNDLREESPIILQGGVIEQWVTVGGREQAKKAANSVTYYHVGSNVWFKEFHIGVHQDKIQDEFVSPHPPISVTGGDYDIFYLTGYYNSPNANYDDNAECYINGGRFGKVAGTGMQGIGAVGGASKGNIIWQIDNADIDEFYAGGINAAHIAEGSIWTIISNSRVDQFCGGPKFGDMNSDKKVVTNAINCTFRTFFGAGYGGNSYNRRYPENKDKVININWNTWVSSEHQKRYNDTYKGVEARIDYQFIPRSDNTSNVARLFVDHVSFSLATTCDVISKLTNCTITTRELGRLDLSSSYQCIGNFYGGGSLGRVTGPVKSTLINCTVEGNVFGAGYSATKPKVKVMTSSFQKEPEYDSNLGAYLEAKLPAIEAEYEWKPLPAGSTTYVDNANHILYAKAEDLEESNLGSVNGDVNLTIKGDSKIGTDDDASGNTGNVFGGGESSYVTGSSHKVTVNLQGNTKVLGNVFGGGDQGLVEGSTTVNIEYEEPTNQP